MKQENSAWGRPHAPALLRWGRKTLSLFLSVVLCLSMLPATALAEETDSGSPKHTDHSNGWTAWDNVASTDYQTTLPSEAGNYYLTENVTLTETWEPADGAVLCLNGYSITGASGKSVISVAENNTFTLTDCKGGGTEYGKITHNSGESGRGVYLNRKATFNMYGGNITGNNGEKGGGVYAMGRYASGSTFNLYGGSVSKNRANKGGGVYVDDNNCTFNMTGGSMTENTATDFGGGVYVCGGSSGATFNMSGGTMTGNIAMKSGGGVYVDGDGSSATFNMTGGSITGNEANNNYGGGVCVDAGSFKIGGAASIRGNKRVETLTVAGASASKKDDSNVYLTNGGLITVTDALANELGVVATAPYRVATGTDERPLTNADLSKFKYEEKYSGVGLYLANGGIWLSKGEPHVHSVPFKDDQLWTPITTADELQAINAEGYYYLKNDITLSSTWEPESGVYLCLDGHSIKCSAENTPVITVGTESNGKSFYLTDCHTGDQVGTITHTDTGSGTGVLVKRGYLNMYNGKITGNQATEENMGGGVHLAGQYTNFYMYKGEITGNTATANGGGVYVANSADFRVYGYDVIKITGNKVSDKDNNVYLANGTNIWADYLETGSEIGITTETAPTAENPVYIVWMSASASQYADLNDFKPDDKRYIVQEKSRDDNDLVLALHEHDWQYTAAPDNSAKINATCTVCNESGTVTVVKPEHATWMDGNSAEATLTTDNWLPDAPTISYSKKDGTALAEAPTAPGEYTASITAGGKTASVDYTIEKGTPTSAPFYISDGASEKTYTGQPQYADIVGYSSSYHVGEVKNVRYYDSTGAEVKEPTNVGVYTVKFDVAGNEYWYPATDLTLTSNTFEIVKADYTGTKTVSVNVPSAGYDKNHVTLPELPTGVSYNTDDSVRRSFATKDGAEQKTLFPSGGFSWDEVGKSFTFKTEPVSAGYSATITVPFTGGTNYNDFDVVVTVNVVDRTQETLNVTMQGWTYGGSLNSPQYTKPKDIIGNPTIKYYKKNADGTYTDEGTYLTQSADAGEYKVTVVCETPLAVYTGEMIFTIAPQSIADFIVTVENANNMIYTGAAWEPQVIVAKGDTGLTKDKDYTVTYENNTNAGSNAKVKITGKGNYTSDVTKTFTITPKALENSMIAAIGAQTYTGEALTPNVTLTYNNKTLVKDTDYTVEYADNINAGTNTAKVTVTGTGNYSGTATANFTINKANQSLSAANLNAIYGKAFEATGITGAQGTVTYTVKTDSESLLTKGEDGKFTAKSGTGTAYITATAAVTDNYNAATIDIPVVLSKATLTAKADNKSMYVNGTVPTNWTVSYTGFVNGDTKDAVVAKDATASIAADVDGKTIGSFAITTNTDTQLKSGMENNYTVAVQNGTLTVSRRSSGGGVSQVTYPVAVPDKTENGSVTVSPKSAKQGDTVTITVTPDAGYALKDVRVTDKSGKDVSLTKKSDTQYTFVMPAGQVEVSASFAKEGAAQSKFVDVKESDYFYDAVQWAAARGITSGTDAEHFSPNASCTRAQIVTFLWRAAGSPEPKQGGSFTDVAAESYYAKAVAWAVENGITTGTGAETFSPDATCTREQAVAFLYRAAGSPAVSGGSAFRDVADSAYYANAVAWAEQNGITGGIGGGLFGAGNDCTRGQIVTFLYRANQQ